MAEGGKRWIRAGAFVRKEVVDIVHQPALVVTLILGPFLVLLAFGAGLGDLATEVRTLFVAPAGSAEAELAEQFTTPTGSRLAVLGVEPDREAALDRLAQGEVDLVVEMPSDAAVAFRDDRRSTVILHHDYVDPIELRALILGVNRTVGAINDQVTTTLVAQSQQDTGALEAQVAQARAALAALRQASARGDEAGATEQREILSGLVADLDADLDVALAGDAGEVLELQAGSDPVEAVEDLAGEDLATLTRSQLAAYEDDLARLQEGIALFRRLSPAVIVQPFAGEARSLSDLDLRLVDFYAPAVVALLLQHMVVTLVALSIVREHGLGTFALFRVAPLTVGELLAGKFAAALLIGVVIAAAVVALLVLGLGVPLAGSVGWLALSLLAVLAASIALGFVIALLAQSDSQAVQSAMLLLLASILLSGFVLTLQYFRPALRAIAWLLPASHGVQLLRELMLRGGPPPWPPLLALGAMTVVLLGAAALLLRRRLARP